MVQHNSIDHSGLLSVSFASNSTRVSTTPAAGASALSSRGDHVHDGAGISARVVGDAGGDFTTTSATFVDVTGASITATTGARRVLLGFTAVGLIAAAATASFTFRVDSTDQGGTTGLMRFQIDTGHANLAHNLSFTYMTDVLSAASHTFKVRALTSASTLTVKNASTSAWVFWVAEMTS